jgi:hypothetical protein
MSYSFRKTFLGDLLFYIFRYSKLRGARWSRGQSARRAIVEAKQRSQSPVIGGVTKIYYLELLLRKAR